MAGSQHLRPDGIHLATYQRPTWHITKTRMCVLNTVRQKPASASRADDTGMAEFLIL
jgi:hypothetical protein